MTARALVLVLGLSLALPTFAASRAGSAPPRGPRTPARGASRTGPLTEGDCTLSTRFTGISPTRDPCTTAKFFNQSPGLPNARAASQVCLGFAGAINAKLSASSGFCKRLTAAAWTEALNMRFIQCVANGSLGKVVWVTKASAIGKTFPDWEKSVTFAEMCYWRRLGKAWPK